MDKNWDKAHHALSPFDFLCYSEHLTISFIVLIAMLATFVVTKFELSFAFLFLILLLCSKIYNHDLARLKRRFKVNAPSAKLDAESVEWFNLFLAKFWLMYEPGLSEMLKDIIDSVLDISKPSFLDQLRLTKFTLGSQGPRIDAIKTYKSESDTLIMDWHLRFVPIDDDDVSPKQKRLGDLRNVFIELTTKIGVGIASVPIKVYLKELELTGTLRFEIKLMTLFPHIKIVNMAFLELPRIDFQLATPGTSDLTAISSLKSFIDSIIDSSLTPMMVIPNYFPINVEEIMYGTSSLEEAPIGLLKVIFYRAHDLKNADLNLTSLSDPFAALKLGGKIVATTNVIDNDLNPIWNESFHCIIYQSTLSQLQNGSDELQLEVLHKGKMQNTVLATTRKLKLSEFIQLLQEDNKRFPELVKGWGTPLNEPKKVTQRLLNDDGTKMKKSTISFDLSYYPIVQQENKVLISKAGIVKITVSQAKELAIPKHGFPYCQIVTHKASFKTKVKKRTNNPVWDAKFEFYCDDVSNAEVELSVLDESSRRECGDCVIKVANSLKKSDEWLDLKNVQSGKIKVSVKFIPVDLSQSHVDRQLVQHYDPLCVLRVNLIEAKGLANVEVLRKSDPYAKVMLGHSLVGISQCIPNTLNPEWRELFYAIPYTAQEALIFEFFDYNDIQKDKWLGKAMLPIGALLEKFHPDLPLSFDEESKKNRDILEAYVADGFTASLNLETETLDIWCPIYVSKADLGSEKSLDANTGLRASTSSLLNSVSQIGSEIVGGKKKMQNKGKVHLSLNIFQIKPADIIRRKLPPAKFEDLKAAEPVAETIKNDGVIEDIPHLPTELGDDESSGPRPSVYQVLETGKKYLTIEKMGIMRFWFDSLHFSREMDRPTFLEIFDEGNLIYKTKPNNGKICEINECKLSLNLVTDRYVSKIRSNDISISLKQVSEDEKAGDILLATWNDNIFDILGKASHSVQLKPNGKSDLIVKLIFSVGFVPVDVGKAEIAPELDNGLLFVDILEAKNLKAVDSGGSSDPYVVVSLNSKQFYKTKTHKKDLNPTFNETCKVEILNRTHSILSFDVFDSNSVSKDVCLGQAQIKLSTVTPELVATHTLNLDQGQIVVRILFDPQMVSKVDMESRLKREQSGVGKFAKGLKSSVSFSKLKDKTSWKFKKPDQLPTFSIRGAEDSQLNSSKQSLTDRKSATESQNSLVEKSLVPNNGVDETARMTKTENPKAAPGQYTLANRRPGSNLNIDRATNVSGFEIKADAPTNVILEINNTVPKIVIQPASPDKPILDEGSNATSAGDDRLSIVEISSSIGESSAVSQFFSSDYHPLIKIGVLGAAGIPGVDSNGLADPYVKVVRQRKKKTLLKTPTVKKSLNPIWKQQKLSTGLETLIFTVYDHNAIASDVKLCQLTLDLSSIINRENQSFDKWFPFDDCPSATLHLVGIVDGRITATELQSESQASSKSASPTH